MIHSLLALLISADVLPAIVLTLKATLVLVAGAAAATLLRQASSAARHLVWVLTLAGCIAVVAFAPFAPSVAVPVPAITEPLPPTAVPHGAAALVSGMPPGRGTMVRSLPDAGIPGSSSRVQPPTSLGGALSIAWAAGFLMVLAWCALGHLALRRLTCSAAVLEDESWRPLKGEAASLAGIEGDVILLESEAVRTPITWGFRHPVVLFPAGASAWSAERKRVVLLHELAHIARRDHASQLIATIACSLFWYHPGVWLAARRLRVEAERACDDSVLGAGMPGVDYATHLLDVARGMRAMRLIGPAVVGMARPSHLEERLLAVLTPVASRRPVRPPVTRLAIATTMLAILPVAGARAELSAAPARQTVEASDAVTRTGTDDSNEAGRGTRPAPLATSRAQKRWDFEDSVPASSNGELYLDLRTGGSVNVLGWDKPWVRVRGELGGRDAKWTRVSLVRSEPGATLRAVLDGARRSSSTSHKFEIRVPKSYNLRLSSSGGGVTLSNLSGEFRGTTGGGPLTLEWLTGSANLNTGGGDIHVSNSELSGRVNTGGGVVVLSGVKGGLRGTSGSGPVVYADDGDGGAEVIGKPIIEGARISVPVTGGVGIGTGSGSGTGAGGGQGAGAPRNSPLHISKAGGAVDLSDAPHGATLHTGGGGIRVARSGGMLDVSTGGGDIELGGVSGSASASTGAGDVHITVVDSNGEAHDVEVISGNGNVVLELPATLDARFELETAYTRNHRSKTKISSDFALEPEETLEWDNNYGSPRKFVRASGAAGNGRGLIRVRTVNGDITVKRTP